MQTIKILALAGLSTSHQCLCVWLNKCSKKIISRKLFLKKIMFLTQVLFLAILVQFSDQQSNQCATKEDVGKLFESENATGAEIKELVEAMNEVRLEIRSVRETTDKQTEEHTRLTQVIKEVDRVTADEIRELRSEIRANKETLDKLTESENTTADKIMELVETSNEIQSEIRNNMNKTKQHTTLTQVIKEVDNATGDEIREIVETLNVLRSEIRNIKDTQMEEHNELKKIIRKGSHPNPAISCSDLLQDSPSGKYWIQTSSRNSPVQVYCDVTRTCCNSTGGWMRVANLDMTDPSQQCPTGFRLVTRTTAPLRTCGRSGPPGCVSTIFPVYGIEYSQVCGRIRAYQDQTPDAFSPYNRARTIDDIYVDGISLTHGQSPRQHIWTFAASLGEIYYNNVAYYCPCSIPSITYDVAVPPYVGNDYFCETGERGQFQYIFHSNDPLWDGQGCGGTSTCCSFNNPPWFCKQLPQPTTDDIELRLCTDQHSGNEDTPLEIVEMYIK